MGSQTDGQTDTYVDRLRDVQKACSQIHRHTADSRTDKKMERQAGKHTNWQSDRQIHRQTHMQADRQMYKQACRQIHRHTAHS